MHFDLCIFLAWYRGIYPGQKVTRGRARAPRSQEQDDLDQQPECV